MSTRIACISDTHGLQGRMSHEVPEETDVLIHAGDFSSIGKYEDFANFRSFMEQQPHQQKIVIAGNHDVTMHSSYYIPKGALRFHKRIIDWENEDQCREYMNKCQNEITSAAFTYLEDSECCLHGTGTKVWGSPWQPEFCDWAFNLEKPEELREKWDMIPDDTDVLITHGPPYGILDKNDMGGHCGCREMLKTIQERVRPRVHIFGHIHEGYGSYFDGTTLFVNASTCTVDYDAENAPIVVDLPKDASQSATVVESA